MMIACCQKDGPPGEGNGANGSVEWYFSLGPANNHESAGLIWFEQDELTEDSYSPDILRYDSSLDEVEVLRDVYGSILQILTPLVLVDVVPTGEFSFDLRYYSASEIIAHPSGYDLRYEINENAEELVRWTTETPIETPGTQIRFVRSEGSDIRTSLYTHDEQAGTWTLDHQDGLQIIERTTQVLGNGQRLRTTIVKNGIGEVASKYSELFITFPWGERRVEKVEDPTGDALTTTWTYYTDETADGDNYGRLKSVEEPTGYWERYEYDEFGAIVKVTSQFLDSVIDDETEANHRVMKVTYQMIDLDEDGLDDFKMTSIEKLLGQEISRSFRIEWGETVEEDGQVLNVGYDVQARNPGVDWDSTNALVTKTWRHGGGEFKGELYRIL